jgi:hypothetical protein
VSSLPSMSSTKTSHTFERILAIAGMVICLALTAILWISISANQSMWPFPGLYFIEMAALSVASARLAFMDGGPVGRLITWSAVGLITGFSILGAWSVGFFYLPVAIIFGGLAILSDVRNKQLIPVHLGVCLIAGVVQVLLMLAAIRLLF